MQEQYTLVQSSRERLFKMCSFLDSEEFVKPISFLGIGSVRNQLVHIYNCYHHWIGVYLLGLKPEYAKFEDYQDLNSIINLFTQCNQLLVRFFEKISDYHTDELFSMSIGDKDLDILKLFTHTVSHEFHHKGQAVAGIRFLGHIPIDSDVIHDS